MDTSNTLESENQDTFERVEELIKEAERLIAVIQSFSEPSSASIQSVIPKSDSSTQQRQLPKLSNAHKSPRLSGIVKLKRRICAELEFLQDLKSGKIKLKKNHLSCSNLVHYGAVIDRVIQERPENVMHVCKIYHLPNRLPEAQKSTFLMNPTTQRRVEVDIVCKNGSCWIKVKAMSPHGVQAIVDGTAQPGHKSVLESAADLLRVAQLNQVHYKPPVVVFHFSRGVTHGVAEQLSKMGIVVEGERIEYEREMEDDESDEDSPEEYETVEPEILDATSRIIEPELPIVNLDVTTLICLVSNVAHGETDCRFDDDLLEAQAAEERISPSLPVLLNFLKGKKIVVTKTAKEKFFGIVKIVAGPKEAERANKLFEDGINGEPLQIVNDEPSERLLDLNGPKIRDQHRIIFGTADRIQATTATANVAFVRSAKERGLMLSIFLHSARALTEQKAIRN